MSAPEVSVVCSTYNRAGRVPSLLAALEAQTLDKSRYEVVIVDNGSTDETAAVLDAFEAQTSMRIERVNLPKNRGASGGRNAGWRSASAPLIAFTDDDCVPDPTWLETGLRTMQDPSIAVLVGQTLPNPAQASNQGPFSRTQKVTEASGTRYMHTCNIVYADIAAVDGFDERFETKGGEDTDLGWRVLDRGGAVAFAEDMLVLHDVSKGSFKAAMREAITWRDIPLVAARHPKRARPLLVHGVFWKRSHEYVVLAIASLGVAAVVRNVVPLVGFAPWLYLRTKKSPMARGKLQRFGYLPHAFAIDAVEVTTMVRGSVKNRTFVL
jgi:glycosyltransferase involved in cell wall biosynthesis